MAPRDHQLSERRSTVDIARVSNEVVWRQLRIIFIGSGLLFLINNFVGFANALTEGQINRGQILVHLHAGSIGWITLSAIGLGIWLVTGQRQVSRDYERQVQRLGWAAVIAFALYVPNFWLAFGPIGLRVVLPIFGIASVLVLWWAAIFVIGQLRQQEPLTAIQLFAGGALLVASIGATVGALLGLEHVIGTFLPLASDRVGAHAAMMDTYLFLVAAAVIEWTARPRSEQRLGWAGMVQAGAWVIGAALVPISYFLDLIDVLLPIFGILLLGGMAIFLVRTAWRALLAGPMATGARAWAFFGTAWLVIYMGLFMWIVSSGADFGALPTWFGPIFAHAGFVGMITNLVLAVHFQRADASRSVAPWAEPAALWLMNLGLLTFFALEITSGVRLGALVMGVGVVLGVGTAIYRLWADGRASVSESPMEARAG
jgi:hypothetical protein